MPQKLILAINKARITAGYLNKNYYNKFGYNHYGWDLTDQNRRDHMVWGCGTGEVITCGFDNYTGWTVVIRYNNVELLSGKVADLIQRSWHYNEIYIKKGQMITKDTRIGKYGSTGKYTTASHYHEEWDTDIKYPCHSPSFKSSTSIIKAGINSTLSPAHILHVKKTNPDNQICKGEPNYNTWDQKDIVEKEY